jgi:hypothetical protein
MAVVADILPNVRAILGVHVQVEFLVVVADVGETDFTHLDAVVRVRV